MFEFFVFNIVVLGLSALDINMTVKNMRKMLILKPNTKYQDYELNPIPIYFWKKFGLKKGKIVGLFFSLIGLSIILSFSYFYTPYFQFIAGSCAGALTIVNTIHFDNEKKLDNKIEKLLKEKEENEK